MLLGNERNYDLGMDALATVCSWETNGIMIWAWMLWPPYALGLLGHERSYDFGMDALLIARIQQLNVLGIGHGCSGDRRHSKNDRATIL